MGPTQGVWLPSGRGVPPSSPMPPPWDVYDQWVRGRPFRPTVEPSLLVGGGFSSVQAEGTFTLSWEIYEWGLTCLTVTVTYPHTEVHEIPLFFWSSQDPFDINNPSPNNPYRIDF